MCPSQIRDSLVKFEEREDVCSVFSCYISGERGRVFSCYISGERGRVFSCCPSQHGAAAQKGAGMILQPAQWGAQLSTGVLGHHLHCGKLKGQLVSFYFWLSTDWHWNLFSLYNLRNGKLRGVKKITTRFYRSVSRTCPIQVRIFWTFHISILNVGNEHSQEQCLKKRPSVQGEVRGFNVSTSSQSKIWVLLCKNRVNCLL